MQVLEIPVDRQTDMPVRQFVPQLGYSTGNSC
jgi:hypothetical protein